MAQSAGCTASDGDAIPTESKARQGGESASTIPQSAMHLAPQIGQPRSEASNGNPSLPYEIYDPIFRMTQPLSHEYSPSVALGPRNPWMVGLRTKKALTLVCKAWSGPATAFLYEDVVIRRMGQICALADTLLHSGSGRNLAQLVQSIRLEDCIVLRHCADSVRRSLYHVLGRCSALTSFTYHPTSPSMWPFDVDRDPRGPESPEFNIDPLWLLGFGRPNLGHSLAYLLQQGLRTLDLDLSGIHNGEQFIGPLYAMLSNASCVTTIVLNSFELRWRRDEWLLSAPPLTFPALETLHIRPQDALICDWMINRWEMPQLKSLTYRSEIDPIEFLEVHGSKLSYAYFGCAAHTLPQLSRLLPVIEHLTLPLLFELEELMVNSATLRYLDIMRESYPTFSDYKSVTFASDAHIPALKRVRLLGYGAWDVAAEYPRLIHPELLPVDVDGPETPQARPKGQDTEPHNANKEPWEDWVAGGVIHRVHGEVLRQKWWGVAHDPWWCPGYVFPRFQYQLGVDVVVDDDDSSYVCSASSSESSDVNADILGEDVDVDEDSWYSEETSSDRSEDTGSMDDMQLDQETVLRMFRAGLAGDLMVVDEAQAEGSVSHDS
ncbi:hypothetical protein OH76DRAFT_717380 [Lentinus brumalis]|uniref:Uncharacterized protein n=1 Tax=Lentinus brumalis TaxID=2498619 RepID=A0A371D5M2_9APHY|nr:hypothetical protein OH76DRAFT_717380 [Polyporus brumalis]